jgi:predicted dithiol-disulfide oxidoreductase (DUF899 family)
MMGSEWEQGCVGCSFLCDHIDGANQHLMQHDVIFVAVSRAPLAKIQSYKKRMGWRFPWVSSYGSDFNFDYHVSFTPEEVFKGKAYYNYEFQDVGHRRAFWPQRVLQGRGGNIFHTFSSYARGGDPFLGAYHYLDITPKGRNETGPGHNLTDWVRRHDEYEKGGRRPFARRVGAE